MAIPQISAVNPGQVIVGSQNLEITLSGSNCGSILTSSSTTLHNAVAGKLLRFGNFVVYDSILQGQIASMVFDLNVFWYYNIETGVESRIDLTTKIQATDIYSRYGLSVYNNELYICVIKQISCVYHPLGYESLYNRIGVFKTSDMVTFSTVINPALLYPGGNVPNTTYSSDSWHHTNLSLQSFNVLDGISYIGVSNSITFVAWKYKSGSYNERYATPTNGMLNNAIRCLSNDYLISYDTSATAKVTNSTNTVITTIQRNSTQSNFNYNDTINDFYSNGSKIFFINSNNLYSTQDFLTSAVEQNFSPILSAQTYKINIVGIDENGNPLLVHNNATYQRYFKWSSSLPLTTLTTASDNFLCDINDSSFYGLSSRSLIYNEMKNQYIIATAYAPLIRKYNFYPEPQVKFGLNNITQKDIIRSSNTEIVFNVPLISGYAPGEYNIQLTNFDGSSSPYLFLIVGEPSSIIIDSQDLNINTLQNTLVSNLSSVSPIVGDTFTYSIVDISDDLNNEYFKIEGNQLFLTQRIDEIPLSKLSVGLRTTNQYDAFYETVISFNIIGKSKKINLVEFLPTNMRYSESYEFVRMFEDYLNGYFGTSGFGYTFDGSGISILEKIQNMIDLRDPSKINVEYLRHFANLLGYEIQYNRDDIKNLTRLLDDTLITDEATEDAVNRYLRRILEESPWFNKLKTTRNAMMFMLYSFGVVGYIRDLYTKNYSNDRNDWLVQYSDETFGEFEGTDFYPTSHFLLTVDISNSTTNWIDNIQAVIRTIEAIKPLNTVFHGIEQYFKNLAVIDVYASNFGTKSNVFIWTGPVAIL